MVYTTGDVIEKFGANRERHSIMAQLCHWRKGTKQKQNHGDKKYEYVRLPELIEGEHWIKAGYNICYTEAGIQKLITLFYKK